MTGSEEWFLFMWFLWSVTTQLSSSFSHCSCFHLSCFSACSTWHLKPVQSPMGPCLTTHTYTTAKSCEAIPQKAFRNQIFTHGDLASLKLLLFWETHRWVLCKNHNPQVKPNNNISWNTVWIHASAKDNIYKKHTIHTHSLSLSSLPCLKLESKGWDPLGSRPFVIGCKLRSSTWWRRSLRQ